MVGGTLGQQKVECKNLGDNGMLSFINGAAKEDGDDESDSADDIQQMIFSREDSC